MADDLAVKLLSTTDARVWAEEFCRIFNDYTVTCGPWADGLLGEGTMVGWFANAIETGRLAGAHIDGDVTP